MIACHIEGCDEPATRGISGCNGYSALCDEHDADMTYLADPLCCTHGLANSPFIDYAALYAATSATPGEDG